MNAARERLGEVRSDPRSRWPALALAAAVGLAVAQLHWTGFVVGGALVGLASRSPRRALLAGTAFGLLAWAAFAALLAANGSLGGYLGTGRLLALSFAVPVVGGALGSLVRGIV